MEENKHAKQAPFYETNPFKLAFSEFTKGFKINQNVSVILLVVGFVMAGVNQLYNINPDSFFDSSVSRSEAFSSFLIFTSFAVVVMSFIYAIFNIIWTGFGASAGISNSKNQSTTFSTAFSQALNKFWSVLLVTFTITVVTFLILLPSIALIAAGTVITSQMGFLPLGVPLLLAGILLFIISVVAALRFYLARMLAVYAVFDQNIGAMEALAKSKKLTSGRLMEAWGMMFATGIIPIVNSVLQPYGLSAYYQQLKNYRDKHLELPNPHALRWLPLIVVLSILMLFLAGGGLIMLFLIATRVS